MDITEQVTKWVENKIGKVINKDLREKISEENSTFDLDVYVNNLLDKYFSEGDIKNLREILSPDSHYDLYFESENSTEDQSTQESLQSESNEFQTLSVDDIIKKLESESKEVKKKYLKILESCAEDLINQSYWNKIKNSLQKIISYENDNEIINLAIKVLHKPLRCSKKPQIVTKGFIAITEVLANQIDLYNLERNDATDKKIHKTEEWRYEKSSGFRTSKNQKSVSAEILIKLMWLLIDCQQNISVKWMRFNEARFREIIFSFVRLLSSTSISENKKISALELLSVLNPKAGWCSYWCHTAVGRNLLCSALRKYKNFFVQVIEIILNHIKTKKFNKLPVIKDDFDLNKKFTESEKFDNYVETSHLKKTDRNKLIFSAPDNTVSDIYKNVRKKSYSEWIVENIPREIVTEAVFFHSICFVSCLIQFKSGRALFPVQTTTRKRLLSVRDFSLSIIEYLENISDCDWNTGVTYTPASKSKVLEMLNILQRVKAHISSSRMNTERQQFPYP